MVGITPRAQHEQPPRRQPLWPAAVLRRRPVSVRRRRLCGLCGGAVAAVAVAMVTVVRLLQATPGSHVCFCLRCHSPSGVVGAAWAAAAARGRQWSTIAWTITIAWSITIPWALRAGQPDHAS
eukprot:SAG22_NODE_35_length_27276_cov_20.395849_7_plen_123_part_00